MSHVRDHLVAMLEQLADPDVRAEVIERARATSLVAGTYINAVRTEIDALRLADEIGRTSAAVDVPPALERPAAGRLVSIGGGR